MTHKSCLRKIEEIAELLKRIPSEIERGDKASEDEDKSRREGSLMRRKGTNKG